MYNKNNYPNYLNISISKPETGKKQRKSKKEKKAYEFSSCWLGHDLILNLYSLGTQKS